MMLSVSKRGKNDILLGSKIKVLYFQQLKTKNKIFIRIKNKINK